MLDHRGPPSGKCLVGAASHGGDDRVVACCRESGRHRGCVAGGLPTWRRADDAGVARSLGCHHLLDVGEYFPVRDVSPKPERLKYKYTLWWC